MKKIFVVYGHYSDESFNASIKTTFIETAKEKGHEIDCVDPVSYTHLTLPTILLV